jgi:hypothetical protein
MPDHEWVCATCGEKNPPFTEVCRDCYRPPEEAVTAAASKPAAALLDEKKQEPQEPDLVEKIERLPSHKKPVAYLFFGVGVVGYGVFEYYPGWGIALGGLAVAVLASLALSRMFPKITIPNIQLPKRFLAKRPMGNQDGGA